MSMKVVPKIEMALALVCLGYIAIHTMLTGEFSEFLVRYNILLPFSLVWLALCLISLGGASLFKIVTSLNVLLSNNVADYAGDKALGTAIWASYISAVLWVLYAVSVTPYDVGSDYWTSLLSASATSLLYGFLLAEFVLRPIKIRATLLLAESKE